MPTVSKKIKHSVIVTNGENGNAFVIMGRFSSAARKQNWTDEEIDVVLKEAMSSDYDHLVSTLRSYCIKG